ncbi:hypothetical protein [Dokdonella sp.]|uniref:hypothetical protein n=1 Tax=Dokdonella sp. TaxID=2291710 RepID=UPI002F40199B
MPRGDKSSYSAKQRRQAEHIEESYEKRGVSKKTAEKRAWATVNKETGGAKGRTASKKASPAKKTPAKKASTKSTSARKKAPAKRASKKSTRTSSSRSAAAKKAARTRARTKR